MDKTMVLYQTLWYYTKDYEYMIYYGKKYETIRYLEKIHGTTQKTMET